MHFGFVGSMIVGSLNLLDNVDVLWSAIQFEPPFSRVQDVPDLIMASFASIRSVFD